MLDFSGISSRSIIGRALRLPLKWIPRSATVRVVQGPLRGGRWIVGAGVHGYWLGSYEREKCALLERIVPPNAVVFDVGANVGYYTLIAARLVGPGGHVYAFEPVPRNVAFLERHLAANGVRNATVVAAAVAASSGVAAFDDTGEPSMGRLSGEGTLRVATVALDELLAAEAVLPPAVLKIDVEGAELSVLTGAERILRVHRPTILLATHGVEEHAACMALLRAAGYAVTALAGADASRTSELLARPVESPA